MASIKIKGESLAMAQVKTKLAAVAGTLAMAGAAALTGATPASAAPSVDWQFISYMNGDITANAFFGGDSYTAGQGKWWRDPSDGEPGDTLVAYDIQSDGYGIEAHLSTGRIATTRGHAAPYIDKVSGNLPEDHAYTMYVCVVKGDWSSCTDTFTVYS